MANKPKDMEGYVGFANLPNQVYRRSVKKGFDFTLMVVGESGLGKSTLINSLFLTDIYSAEFPGPSQRMHKTVKVETSQVNAKENGVKLRLTVVDTPGFGDQVDNSNCWQPILDHIDSKFEDYLNAEARVNRNSCIPDKRVHCCLYFISPSGHGLKSLDIEFMKRLHDKVNIIPLIAKADTMTPEECRQFKKTIMEEIDANGIKIYEFPDIEDEEETKENKKVPSRRNGPKDKESTPNTLKERVPFAVVGSNMIMEVSGKRVRGRQYPWGIAEVENLDHCDFIPLRNMLIRTHMQDLKDVTNNVHYENYRCHKLTAITAGDKKISSNGIGGGDHRISSKNPMAQFEDEKREHAVKMKKMENEMEQVFEMKVKEKKKKLEDSEKELHHRLEQMKKNLEQNRRDLEEKRRQFDKDKILFEETQRRLDNARTLDSKKSKIKKTIF